MNAINHPALIVTPEDGLICWPHENGVCKLIETQRYADESDREGDENPLPWELLWIDGDSGIRRFEKLLDPACGPFSAGDHREIAGYMASAPPEAVEIVDEIMS